MLEDKETRDKHVFESMCIALRELKVNSEFISYYFGKKNKEIRIGDNCLITCWTEWGTLLPVSSIFWLSLHRLFSLLNLWSVLWHAFRWTAHLWFLAETEMHCVFLMQGCQMQVWYSVMPLNLNLSSTKLYLFRIFFLPVYLKQNCSM